MGEKYKFTFREKKKSRGKIVKLNWGIKLTNNNNIIMNLN